MRRFNFNFVVTISVDGVVRDQCTLWCHQQQEPDPGGHRYEATLQGMGVFAYLRSLPTQVAARLDAGVANDFLNRICSTFEVAGSAPPPWEFILNTVDRVQAAGDTVQIAGECSTFVRSQRTLNKPAP